MIGMSVLVPLTAVVGFLVFAVIAWVGAGGSRRGSRSGLGCLLGAVVAGTLVLGLLGTGVSFRAVSFSPRQHAWHGHAAGHQDGSAEATVSPAQVAVIDASLPEWARHACRDISQIERSRTQVVLQSGLFATREEAETDVLRKAARLVIRRVAPAQSFWTGHWTPDLSLVKQQLVRRTEVQSVQRDFGGVVATMYRQYAQVDLSQRALEPLRQDWQRSVAHHRVLLLTYALAGTVIFLGLLSTLLRSERRAGVPGDVSPPEPRPAV